jgi:hypothetical protein
MSVSNHIGVLEKLCETRDIYAVHYAANTRAIATRTVRTVHTTIVLLQLERTWHGRTHSLLAWCQQITINLTT